MSTLSGFSPPKSLRKSQSSLSSSQSILSKTKLEEVKKRAYRKNKLFRRIEADIKERDRKRVPGRMESYIDHDRQIAVSIGTSDIRSSIMKQKGYLMRHSLFANEDGNGFRVLLEQASHEIHRGAYDIGLQYLNKALTMNPNQPECLILRGTCLVGLQDFSAALEDANAVIQMGAGQNAKTFLVKGDALYHLGEFEHALVHYHRALQSTSTTLEDEIRKGIRRSEEAIDNSLGIKATGHFLAMPAVLNSIPSTIFGMPWHELKLLKWKQIEEKPVEKPKMSTATATSGNNNNSNSSSTTAKAAKTATTLTKNKRRRNLLLGKLSDDLDYLEGLLTDVQLAEPFNEDSEEKNTFNMNNKNVHLKRAAEDAISFLNNRQEFWSQFKPVYSKQ